MALVVDAVPLFLDHVWRQLKPVRDALLAVGFLYTVKKVVVVTKDACVGLKVFGASRIFHDADFPTRYGAKWAGEKHSSRDKISVCHDFRKKC